MLPRVQVTAARNTPDQQGSARVPVRSQTARNLFFAGNARDLPYNLTDISLASALEVAELIGRELPTRRRVPVEAVH